jgi:hypothetical protein
MTAVEFFDLNTGKWINLPNLERGRCVMLLIQKSVEAQDKGDFLSISGSKKSSRS